jgi:probable lipoprotein NlpC
MKYHLCVLWAGCFLLGLSGASLFGEPPLADITTDDARLSLIEAASQYLGTPYRYGGLNQYGLDCSGLIYLSLRDSLEVEAPRISEDLYRWTERLPDAELQPGDLVFFIRNGHIFHVGMYTGEGSFIHAASDGPHTGVIYSRLDESFWRRTYAGAGRVLPEIRREEPLLE